MAKPSANPLDHTDRLLVDGTNLLHAMRRGRPAAPAVTLIGRLRAAIPPAIGIELVLDGAPDPGMRNQRVAGGLIVRWSGRRSADQVLFDLVDDVRRGAAAGERRAAVDNVLVVTDDNELRVALQNLGARTAGTKWLIGKLERGRVESPTTGNRRPPTPPPAGADNDGEPDRPGWQPGRGATTKRGNPRRVARSRAESRTNDETGGR
jgi:hypothetical protein